MPGRCTATPAGRRGARAPLRLVLTRRALEDPIRGSQCGGCLEPRWLQQLVVLGPEQRSGGVEFVRPVAAGDWDDRFHGARRRSPR